MLQLDAQDDGLQLIQPAVVANDIVMIAFTAAVIAQHAQLIGALFAIGCDQSAITKTAQVLAGEKAEGTEVTEAAGLFVIDVCAERLCAVFNNFQTFIITQSLQSIHIDRLAEQMHGNDRPGFAGNGLLNLVEVDVKGVRIDINEHRDGADIADGFCRGDKGKRRGDDFVTFTDAGSSERKVQCVRARGHANGVFDTEILSRFFLECLNIGPKDKLGCRQPVKQSGVDLVFERQVLTLEVDHGDVHLYKPFFICLSALLIFVWRHPVHGDRPRH